MSEFDDQTQRLQALQLMTLEASKAAVENLAKSRDVKAIARASRKAASRADRIAKGYETGI